MDALCEGAAGRQFGELPRSQDEDGGETAVKWQWYRGGTSATTADELSVLVATDTD